VTYCLPNPSWRLPVLGRTRTHDGVQCNSVQLSKSLNFTVSSFLRDPFSHLHLVYKTSCSLSISFFKARHCSMKTNYENSTKLIQFGIVQNAMDSFHAGRCLKFLKGISIKDKKSPLYIFCWLQWL
jgi:hypothetical protein